VACGLGADGVGGDYRDILPDASLDCGLSAESEGSDCARLVMTCLQYWGLACGGKRPASNIGKTASWLLSVCDR